MAKKSTAKSSIKKSVKTVIKKLVAKTLSRAKAKPKAKPKPKAKTKAKSKPATKTTPRSEKRPAAAASPKNACTYKLNEGDSVPSFSGASTSGQAINQDLYSTKTVVLYFYPRDNTPGCTLEGQDFRRLYKNFLAGGAEIVGASQDSIDSHVKFKSKCDFPFHLLYDADGSVCRAFDVMQMKSMYGKDFLGIERSTFLIHKGVIKNIWRKVKVVGHADEVLAAVEAL